MGSQAKKFTGNSLGKSQAWGLVPPVSANAPTWNLTLNGKTLSYKSSGSSGDAVTGMQALWAASRFPDFVEITASIPSATNLPDNPQGPGTNEIQALYLSGSPTGGSFQIAWGGVTTPFLVDPDPDTTAPGATDSGSAGNPNGAYKYTYTFINVNALGQIGETKPSGEGTVTVTSHSITVTVPAGPLGTIGRRIYRTAAGGATGTEKLVATIWDNTTSSYLDNLADGSLGAAQPTANSTGILYNATATQLQSILQGISSISQGNAVVTGSGTTADPWLVQFVNSLGALQQSLILAGPCSLNYTATVPATSAPKLIVTEIQQGLAPNTAPSTAGDVLLLVSKTGVPFYLTSTVTGSIPPEIHVNNVTPFPPPHNESIGIVAVPPSISVARVTAGAPGGNDLQQIEITPNAESGSTFTLTFGGDTTNDIPTPPGAPTVAAGSAGNPNGAYYYTVSFLTASGETEPSAPSAQITLTNVQGTVTIPTGPAVVTKRRIYRTLAGGAITGPYYFLNTVNDNTTTSYADNNSDATIKLNPQAPTTNGVLQAELESLASVGIGNIQVSGANASAYLGMTLQQGFAALPTGISTAQTHGLAGPDLPTLTTGKGGGSLASGTYFYVITSVDAFGETLPGQESSITVIGPTASVAISWTAVTNAKGYKIYRGTSAGNENVLVGTSGASATSFIDYGSYPAPIVYRIEFIGGLKNAAQALITGSVANVTILPTITLSETQAGSPIQNEVQQIGWTQLYGDNAPDGTFTIGFPSLGVTTDIIQWNATEDQVKNKVKAALPASYANSIAVTLARGGGSVANLVNIFQFVYQDRLALTAMPLATINLSGMIPGAGDTVSPYEKRLLVGSPVGRNEIITATINNAPSGGTFGLTGTLANGNTISATGVAHNASASTLQAAFPAATVTVSGSAGGPYTIEAAGEAGSQKVVWTATSSLTGASSVSGSPPGSNTTTLSAPTSPSASQGGLNGNLAAATYYYVITATNAAGETTPSSEVSCVVDGVIGDSANISWSSVIGATGYKVYRGTSAGSENTLIASGITEAFVNDQGGLNISASPPVSNTAGISAPVLTSAVGSATAGNLATATYYYKITATNTSGETIGSNEISASVTGPNARVDLQWSTSSGATGYNVYRGTSAGSENTLIASRSGVSLNRYQDAGNLTTAATPPGSNTTTLSAPVQTAPSTSALGGNLATDTYYYEVTAINDLGETTASNEENIAVTGPTGEVTINWNAVSGATGYKIYRGTSASGENAMVAIIGLGATVTYTDVGNVSALFESKHLANGEAAVNESQTITITNAGGGYFEIINDGQNTNPLAWNSSAATIQTAIQSLSSIGSGNVSVSASTSNGQTVYTITFVSGLASQSQQLLQIANSSLAGGSTYIVSLSSGATDNFTLSFGGDTTSAIAAGASAATVQTDLRALTSIGGTNATVTGSNGGPWSVTLDASIVGTGVLTGTIVTQVSSGAADAIYLVDIPSASAGTFQLIYGTSVSIGYNSTAGQVKSALETTQIGTGNVTVTGFAGGPWTITITPTVQNSGLALTGAIGSLVGSKTSVNVYPLVYAMAVGPNFFDAAANWDGGVLPATYLSPPTISAVTPISTDATLVSGTHGSLTSGQTYYYKVTAKNTNGETNGSTEQSAQAFVGAKMYFNGTATAGTYTLTYGGQTATGIAYNASAATIQGDLEGLSSIGSGNCTVTGTGTAADPFVFQLSGTLAGHAPTPLSANSGGLTGATLSVYNLDTRSLAVSWNELPTATGYNVYRGTSAGAENLLVAAIPTPDQTLFVDDGTYTTVAGTPPSAGNSYNTAVGDDLYFQNSSVSCIYNVGAAIANGYSVHGGYNGSNYWAFNSFTADTTYTGRIGLPATNPSGYQEYRPLALEINGPPGGDMAVEIGGGSGQGSSFINLDTGTSQVSVSVSGAAPSTGTTPAVLWIGTNSASEVNLYRGSMGIGYYPGQTYQVGTVRQSFVDNPASDTSLIMGEGGTGITLFVQSGGDCLLSTSVATITGKGGTLMQDGGGVTTLLNLSGTTYTSRSTGTIVALKVSGTGEFDRSQDSRALSLGSVSLYAGSTYLDPHGCTVTTGQSYLAYSLVECGYEDVTLKLGKNISAQRTQN